MTEEEQLRKKLAKRESLYNTPGVYDAKTKEIERMFIEKIKERLKYFDKIEEEEDENGDEDIDFNKYYQ